MQAEMLHSLLVLGGGSLLAGYVSLFAVDSLVYEGLLGRVELGRIGKSGRLMETGI